MSAADILLFGAIVFIGLGIFALYPAVFPFFLLTIGLVMFALWAMALTKGKRIRK